MTPIRRKYRRGMLCRRMLWTPPASEMWAGQWQAGLPKSSAPLPRS